MARTVFQTDEEKSLTSNTLRSKPDNLLFQNINSFLGGSKNMWEKSTSNSKVTKKSEGGFETIDQRMIKVEGEQ